ncbi:metal-dependent hydrolase [Halolamina pelagica]|uniref:metal-dependent hydrolase n=1 Tax=Halolamina pelagica TaxID=699431 RepID=UPI0009B5CEFC|nr:metal-dependent hydrolase [Halolamina pelagica]
MWPWDHAAVGYLLVSGASRLLWGRPPSRRVGALAVVAAVLPDLIDKPLSWGLGLLPSGRSLAHSLLIAAPVLILLLGIGIAYHRRRAAVAFSIAYLSHLAGDVAYPLLVDGELRLGFLLWPLVPAGTSGSGAGVPYLADLVVDFIDVLASPRGLAYLTVDALVLGLAVVVWWRDRRTDRGARSKRVAPGAED